MRSGSSSYYYDSEGIEEEEQRLDGIAGRAFMGYVVDTYIINSMLS